MQNDILFYQNCIFEFVESILENLIFCNTIWQVWHLTLNFATREFVEFMTNGSL